MLTPEQGRARMQKLTARGRKARAAQRMANLQRAAQTAKRSKAAMELLEAQNALAGSKAALLLPLQTKNPTNNRQHWRTVWRRSKLEREMAHFCATQRLTRPELPATIVLTRMSPGTRFMDDDGVRAALKAVRDGIADWLGIDDGSDQVKWSYVQARASFHAVRVEALPC